MLLSTTKNGQTTTFTYNSLQGPTKITKGDEEINITWTNGELTGYGELLFEYDELGLRTKKINQNSITNYYYNNDLLIKSVKDNVIINYLYDINNQLFGFEYNSKTYLYIRDLLGNINQIVDSNGNVMVKYSYTAFGEVTIQNPYSVNHNLHQLSELLIEHNALLYKGYCYDVETQLFYCNSRYYSPELCRWISPDSIEYLDPESINGLNLYCYCANNPVMCRFGYNLEGGISAPISNIGSISSNISSISRSSSARIMSRVSASSTPFANVVSMTNYSTTLLDNILFGMALGNISHTTTIQHNNSGVFYAYSNIGNSTSSVGVGLNIKDWYGLNAYVSSNIGIGSSMQFGSITFGAEVSVLDGVSFSFGTVTGNVTNETTVSIGWGTLAFAYAACGAIAATPVPMARAVAAAAVCVVVLIDIFN